MNTNFEAMTERLTATEDGNCSVCGAPCKVSALRSVCSDECGEKGAVMAERRFRFEQKKPELKSFWYDGLIAHETYQAFPNGYRMTEPARLLGQAAFRKGYGLDKNAWLCGPGGCGKTWAARRIMVDSWYFYDATIAEISAREAFWEGTKHRLWRMWANVDILLLDDMDKARWDDRFGAANMLWELLNKRADSGGLTICTANVTGREFVQQVIQAGVQSSVISPAIERLRPCAGIQLPKDSPNLRREAAKGDA